MGEGEGRDEAREEEPKHDKDDAEDDHGDLVSVQIFGEEDYRGSDRRRPSAWPCPFALV
jgi:hypothetical protein